MVLSHTLYARDRNKSLLTAFYRRGSCTSYETIRSARIRLASYVAKWSADGETPIPSTFTRDEYIMAGMANSVYEDTSSLSGTMGSHYAAFRTVPRCHTEQTAQ